MGVSKRTKTLTVLSLSVAVAMLLSYVEHLLPAFSIPGVKIGLANIATLLALYTLGAWYAAAVSVVRVVLSSLLFGNVLGLLYAISGAVVSLVGMCLVKKIRIFSVVGVSVVGGVLHNVAQIIAASLVMETAALAAFYLPVLLLSGTLAGVAVGVASGLLIKRIAPKL